MELLQSCTNPLIYYFSIYTGMLEFLFSMVALNTWFVIGDTVGYHDDGIDCISKAEVIMPIWYIFYIGISMLVKRCQIEINRWSSALWAINIYMYKFYRDNAKLDMPFWYYFDISIPMLARYSGRRRIDMDPIQFDNLRGVLYSESFFSSNDWMDHLEVTWRLHAYFLTFTFGKNFQFVHWMLQ